MVKDMLQQDPADRPRDAYVVMQRLLEINRKAKDGTLTKTRADQQVDNSLTETVALNTKSASIGTMLKTIGSKLTLTGKAKRRGRLFDPAFFESATFLVLCLAAIAGFIAYMLWPLGPDALFERGVALMQSTDYATWKRAEERYFGPLLEKYPETRHREQVGEYLDQIRLSEAQGRMQRALQFERIPDGATEGFRKTYEAMQIKQVLNDEATAQERFRAIAKLFENDPNERMWVLYAQDQLSKQVEYKDDETRIAAKRTAVANALSRGEGLQEKGKLAEAARINGSIVELYGDDQEVADLVSEARDRLLGKSKSKSQDNRSRNEKAKEKGDASDPSNSKPASPSS